LAGAVKVPWNLSANVMPVPPDGLYGTQDIQGSDTASKLIVNQPMGTTQVAITGAMNGLAPNTTYTVYLSNGYTPYHDTGWNVKGNWILSFEYQGGHYAHGATFNQTNDTIDGVNGGYPAGGPFSYTWDIMNGSISANAINYTAVFTGSPDATGTIWHVTGTIDADGSMSGTWDDNYMGGNRTGTWASTSGAAVKTHTGDSGWTGLFTSTIQPFTFVTDTYGAGSWHVNLRDADLPGTGVLYMSVWINNGGTLLISDTFTVTKG
jgi:hypothetical protein